MFYGIASLASKCDKVLGSGVSELLKIVLLKIPHRRLFQRSGIFLWLGKSESCFMASCDF